jgi:hypothetical protein
MIHRQLHHATGHNRAEPEQTSFRADYSCLAGVSRECLESLELRRAIAVSMVVRP